MPKNLSYSEYLNGVYFQKKENSLEEITDFLSLIEKLVTGYDFCENPGRYFRSYFNQYVYQGKKEFNLVFEYVFMNGLEHREVLFANLRSGGRKPEKIANARRTLGVTLPYSEKEINGLFHKTDDLNFKLLLINIKKKCELDTSDFESMPLAP